MTRKPSPAQITALENAIKHGRGRMSQFAALPVTIAAMLRRGWIEMRLGYAVTPDGYAAVGYCPDCLMPREAHYAMCANCAHYEACRCETAHSATR